MDLIDVPENPTICIMCKNYYCTYIVPTTVINSSYMELMTKEGYAKAVSKLKQQSGWDHHRCKAREIINFSLISGEVDRKDEYCTNVNTNGRCKYFMRKEGE